jgi:hypothetical protein
VDRMMASYDIVLPYVGIAFGVDAGGRGSKAKQCASSFGDVESRRRVAAGPLALDVDWFDTLVGRLVLYDPCKASCQSLLNK